MKTLDFMNFVLCIVFGLFAIVAIIAVVFYSAWWHLMTFFMASVMFWASFTDKAYGETSVKMWFESKLKKGGKR